MKSQPDPIVEEVRRIRKENAAKSGNDIRKIIADVRRRQGKSGRKVVTLTPAK